MTPIVLIDSNAIVSGVKVLEERPALAGLSEAERNVLGWFNVVDNPPAVDPATQILVPNGLSLVNGIPTRQYTVAAKPIPLTPQQIAQALLASNEPTAVVLRGLIQLLAQQFNKTPAQVLTAILNAAN